jgi:polyhydroxyalkanoate synthase
MKSPESKQEHDEIGIAERAASALEAGEDAGELDLKQTLRSLGKVVSPSAIAKETVILGTELFKVAIGTSEITPDKRDWRFKDEAWQSNPVYKRLGQSYLAFCKGANGILGTGADWRTQQRAKFALDVATSALAPTNTLLGNPAAIKKAVETKGMSLVRGVGNFVSDVRHNGGMPKMVDDSPFIKGENIAATPGAIVFRNDLLELIQYRPSTDAVRSIPVLLIPPQINKYYFLDMAPGRSMVEYAVGQGIQTFIVSWRNPSENDCDWNLDSYVSALLEAIDAINSITRTKKINTMGFCAGGITMSAMLSYMAANDDNRVNSIAYAVTLLDWNTPSQVGALQSEELIRVTKNRSRQKGVTSGRDLGMVFAWFRPNELVWNYWVNNYLMGENPPSFDILAWNADAANLPSGLHSEFLDIFLHNQLTRPGAVEILGTPLDLSKITADAYVTGATNDHLTPWKGCYQTTQLLGGDCTFVLSHAGHIASLVNPPGNPKASYYVGSRPGNDPDAWQGQAEKTQGSWWEHWGKWVSDRAGNEKAAAKTLGNKKYPELEAAPGSYIHG